MGFWSRSSSSLVLLAKRKPDIGRVPRSSNRSIYVDGRDDVLETAVSIMRVKVSAQARSDVGVRSSRRN
jgi:hypothetical protein